MVVLVLVLAAAWVAPAASAQEVLTNDAVMTMVKAGLSESVVLEKIRSSPTKFDVKTEALVALKQAGVSDRVIEAMVSQGSSPAGAPPVVLSPGAMGVPIPTRDREVIYHLPGEKHVELQPQIVEVQTNTAWFTYKSEVVLAGRRASYRVSDRQPVFYSSYGPTEALLGRLKSGDDHDDRNLKMGSGAFMPFGGTMRQGVRAEHRIEVTAEKDSRGMYRISPRTPLMPGEYGFAVLGGHVTQSAGRIFDFGVD